MTDKPTKPKKKVASTKKKKPSLKPVVSAKGKKVVLPDEEWAEEVRPCLDGLNEQQTAFVLEYVKDWNRVRAYRAAYGEHLTYFVAAQSAHRLLKDVEKIRSAIRIVGSTVKREHQCDPAFIVSRLSSLASITMKDFMRINDDGTVVTDFSLADDEKLAAIQELHTEEFFEPAIEDGQLVQRRGQRVKVKLIDQRGVLNDLAKYHKMYDTNFSPRAETATILDDWEADKLTTKEAAVRFAKLGLPLPEVLRIELSKQEPEQPQVADPITPEEMDRKYQEAMEERNRQKETFLPERRQEVIELKEEVKSASSFDPLNNKDEFA